MSLTSQVLSMMGTGRFGFLVRIPHPVAFLRLYTLMVWASWASASGSWRRVKTGSTCFTTIYQQPPPTVRHLLHQDHR